MTFTEAAVEVLRLVGKPLHYKKITEVAIERNLLSHVGKTPEVTMSSRLATMVKRDRGEAPIIKVKPGVFGLREFSEEQLADLSGDVDELPEVEVTENEQVKPEEVTVDANGEVEAKPIVVPPPRKPLPGADVFPEEEDDDEPILGGDDDDDDDDDEEAEEGGAAGEAGAGAESRSQRRRRKRRRRGGADEPAEEARPVEARPEREPREPREPRVELNREGRGNRREERSSRREERNPRRDSRERDGRDNRESRDRDNRDNREREERLPMRRDELSLDMSREPADGDLLGKELADAVASVLAQSGPRGMPAIRVADMLVRKGRLQGDPNALLPTVMAAVRADVARRRHEPRPRFRVEGSSLVLTEFLLPQDVVRAEQDVIRAAERQRERARRAFLRKLAELPGAGLAEIAATWLNAEGVVGLRAVRRPTAAPGELHLAGTLRRGPEEVRIAIIICRDGRELGREKVIEARGALHYYGSATTAWLITLGSVMSGAREEALAPATAPVALFDGLALATAMERVGVGLGVQMVAISSLDFELLDALRGAPAREREREPEQERGRGRERERERERPERPERPERAERTERERGGRDRGERERPRLVLERPPVALEESEELEEEVSELEEGVEEPNGELAEDELEATPAGAAEGDKEQGEAREGGRRRRRRRRRKGGRGEDAQAGGAAGEAGEGVASDDALAVDSDDEDEESEPVLDEEGDAPRPDSPPQLTYPRSRSQSLVSNEPALETAEPLDERDESEERDEDDDEDVPADSAPDLESSDDEEPESENRVAAEEDDEQSGRGSD